MFHSTYFGINIYRKDTPGPQLRWTAPFCFGRSYAADTLDGLRSLIRSDTGVRCVNRPRR